MKKLLISVILSFSVLAACCIVGCGCSHNWVLQSTTATCTAVGQATYVCSLCGDTKIEEASVKAHTYETVSNTATCTSSGVLTKKCPACGATKTEKSKAFGHSYVHRVCQNCDYTPLSRFVFSWGLNSVGGINTRVWVTNTSSQRIKYLRFYVYMSNAVGDSLKDDIKHKSTIYVECIGYFEIGVETKAYDGIIGYCENCARITIKEITIVYEDSSQETIANNYYYE